MIEIKRKEVFMMYDFKNLKRVKVTVDRLQNDASAKNYGCNIEKGSQIWIMVLGNVVNVKDPEEAYYLENIEGCRITGGFPVGYAHCENQKYMLHLLAPGFYGAFEY